MVESSCGAAFFAFVACSCSVQSGRYNRHAQDVEMNHRDRSML
jgi:hypothetical protein